MKKAAKQQNIQTLSLKFDGGINSSQAPANIADNELVRATNIIYNSQTGTPETRPGTSCVTNTTCDGTNPLLKGYYYEKSSTQAWHIVACNGNLYNVSKANTLSGTLTLSQLQLSLVNGTAFLNATGITFSDYLNGYITITDSAGKSAAGYIKAVGTVETLGPELLTNTAFEDTTGVTGQNCTVASVAGGQSGNCLEITRTGGTYQSGHQTSTGLTTGQLFTGSGYVKSGTSGNESYRFAWNTAVDAGGLGRDQSGTSSSTWTVKSTYMTLPSGTQIVFQPYKLTSTAGTMLFDTVSLKQVLTPSASGATITSTKGGSTYNWASVQTGFNPNDSSGYTFTITTNFTLIGALNDTTTVPSFLTFNSKLLIADGGQHIKTWDGTTYGTLDDGLYATALKAIKGRVVANSKTSPDLVTLTGAYDETAWNTSTEGAVGLRAGYGDNMQVVGFAVFGDDLLIFKKGDSEKKIYRLNVADATTTNWYVALLSNNNTMQNHSCAVGAFNNVFFVDTNGFKSINGVTEYGDLQVEMTGSNVNTLFGTNDCDEVTYLPIYTAIWCLISTQVYCYHKLTLTGEDAFTSISFKQGRIRSVYQAGTDVYLCGNDGYLYKMDTSVSTDATSPSTTEAFQSTIRTKQFSFTSDGIIRKTQVYIQRIKAGTLVLKVITPESATPLVLKTITLAAPGIYIYDMTDDIPDYTDTLYEMDAEADFDLSWNRARGTSIQFELNTTSGRCGFEGLKTEIALVGN